MTQLYELVGLRRASYDGPPHRWADLFGVEIELENVNTAPRIAGWTVHDDGSLRNGIEYVTHVPMGGATLTKAINAFFDVGIKSNNTERASTHVHINMLDATIETLRSLMMIMYVIETPLYEVVGAARKWGGYSMPLAEMEPQRLAKIMQADGVVLLTNLMTGRNQDRYYGLNVASLRKHGTVEFRYFPSNPTKQELTDWIDLTVAIKKAASNITPDQLIEKIDTPAALVQFLHNALPAAWFQRFMRVTNDEILFENFNSISALATDEGLAFARRESLVFINDALLKYVTKNLVITPSGIAYLNKIKDELKVVTEGEFRWHIDKARVLDAAIDREQGIYAWDELAPARPRGLRIPARRPGAAYGENPYDEVQRLFGDAPVPDVFENEDE